VLRPNNTTDNNNYIYSGVWEGGYPRDKDGIPVSNSTYHRSLWDADTQTISFPQPLLGTLRFKFLEEYDSYTLTIPPRTNVTDIYDIDMIYDATVWAFYSGQYTKKEIDIPDEARECPVYGTDSEGNTYITNGNQYGYDTDGDGVIDGGSDNPCTCPFCAGTGELLDCESSETVDCSCPYCGGDGIVPGCQEESEGSTDSGDDGGDGGSGQTDGSGICYELRIKRHRCTGEILDKQLVEVPCSDE
jgi:hypothetical protein